ncbi:serine/threonine-protein kinase [Actinomadura sp. HBU206391]|uniref:serine/threonine-protein kinase n=1 Tax=Actinomadura sp. HBU206391 TaxID=2731692 RepID=UPI001650420E|nr:serine/threonine-protein kinase [Actinomadura sp. HBU206391]MBC6457632.1 protein kinase [Actinomadura sp. HBU206391]
MRELGEGSAGRVMLAVHSETDTPVAIKYLSARLYNDTEFTERFRDEARLLSEIDDPNLVRFFEYVETRYGAAIVMELINGISLADLIKAEGETGPEAALLVLKGSLLGLNAAHLAGVVHRDFKPGNVLVRGDGVSKLADFGIAVRAGENVPAAGTPAYMAPEQWRGVPVSPATDVYAATAVFYECLTGERPFPAKTLPQLAVAHRNAPIPVDHVPQPLRDLVLQGMAKDPADRPASAAEFLGRLEAIALAEYGTEWEEEGRNRLAERAAILALRLPSSGKEGQGATALAVTELGTMARIGQKVMRRGLVATTAAVVAVVLVGSSVAVYAANRGDGKPKKPPLAGPSVPGDPSAGPSVDPSGDPSTEPSPSPTDTSPSPAVPVLDDTTPADGGDPAGPAPGGGPAPRIEPGRPVIVDDDDDPPSEEPPATKATNVAINSWSRGESRTTGTVSFTVEASGTGSITITVSYSSGQTHTFTREGSTKYELTDSGTFESSCEDWTVTVSSGGVTGSQTLKGNCTNETPTKETRRLS